MSCNGDRPSPIEIRLLGDFSIRWGGVELNLPKSRKARALLAYLSLAPRPVTRTHLCALLGDGTSDPPGELRWCLSRIRSLIQHTDIRLVTTSGRVSLQMPASAVDAGVVLRLSAGGVACADESVLEEIVRLCVGEFLGSMMLERSPQLHAWVLGQRRRFREIHLGSLKRLLELLQPDDPRSAVLLEKWLVMAPDDPAAHTALLRSLASAGRIRECETHIADALRLFESDGFDCEPLREEWAATIERYRTEGGRPSRQSRSSARARVAVLPLLDLTRGPYAAPGGLAVIFATELGRRLAQLLSVEVIGQPPVNSPPAFLKVNAREDALDSSASYRLNGTCTCDEGRAHVTLELVDTRLGRILWSGDFNHRSEDDPAWLPGLFDRIAGKVIAEVESAERDRTVHVPIGSLNAWEAYHRAFAHLYRFTAIDNDEAQRLYQRAVELDASLARAYAGLSFTHFQNAFLHRTPEREREITQAIATASAALSIDPADPLCHWAMGRALWLQGSRLECLRELRRAVELCPGFGRGHYMLAFVQSQSGDPSEAIAHAREAMRLSPFDPMDFAAFASRSIAHLRLGDAAEAARWAAAAANRPHAHVHIKAIAAHCLATANLFNDAIACVSAIRRESPAYRLRTLLGSFRLCDDAAEIFDRRACLIDMD